jgi:hypothetical protein
MVGGTSDLGSCPVVGFGIISVECSGPAIRVSS